MDRTAVRIHLHIEQIRVATAGIPGFILAHILR